MSKISIEMKIFRSPFSCEQRLGVRVILKNVNFNKYFVTILLAALLSSITILPALSIDDGDNREDDTQPGVINFDGISIDQDVFEDTISDALRSKDEQEKAAHANSNDKHPFDRACPAGYFICDNGECIAPRWRCDGHADCDDYSDELNCTALDLPQISPSGGSTQKLPNMTAAHLNKLPVQVYGLDFNSTVEPLMIFSTGQSIRGLWMRSRLYFDIVTRKQVRSSGDTSAQQSITEAFSLFFGILGLDPSRSGLVPANSDGGVGSAAKPADQETNGKPDNTIVGLDMNPFNKEVFWVELGKDPAVYSAVIQDEHFEARQRRQYHGHKKIVEYGLLSPEDIALDTVGKNAYITDAGLPAIVVCSYVHVHCKILVQTKIHKPRAIIADSTNGWIVFTDWGDRPGIFLVSMDGERRETLIETDVVWPNGLAHDYRANCLYWADARLNKIEKVDLKTRKRTELVKEIGANPFSVSVFENRVYWSDWSGNEIKTCDKETGNNTRTVIRVNDIYGIHIYHPDLQKTEDISNPCWSKHCSHLCLLSPARSSKFGIRHTGVVNAACACPDSMALSIFDKSTCYEAHYSFLLVNVNNYIAQVFPERIGLRVVEEIVHSKEHAIQDIASDWTHYKLFFFDASKKQIFSADFSGRQATIQKFTNIGTKSIRGLVYDLPSDNLFWIDPELGTLTLCSVRGGKFRKILRHNLEHATSMVLDAKNRVFYIAFAGPKRRIIRTDIMANEASDVVVLDSDDLGAPVALHLDGQMQRLYWADGKYGHIESIELDVKSRDTGSKPGTRVNHRGRLGSILSFAVYRDYLMWVVEDSDYVFRVRKDDRHSRPVSFKLPPSVSRGAMSTDYRRLISLNPMTETMNSPCSKRGCSHACIVDRDREAKCICPDGYKLQLPTNRSNCVESSRTETVLDVQAPTPLLRPSVMNKLASSDSKRPISEQEIDELTRTRGNNDSKHAKVVEHFGGHGENSGSSSGDASVSHAKMSDLPHVVMDGGHHDELPHIEFDHLSASHSDSHQHLSHEEQQQQQSKAAEAAGLESVPKSENTARGSKLVWLSTILLVLTGGGLVTIVGIMILNKSGRLPRQMSQFKVSFISPGSSTGASASAAHAPGTTNNNDKTMLLLDTDDS